MVIHQNGLQVGQMERPVHYLLIIKRFLIEWELYVQKNIPNRWLQVLQTLDLSIVILMLRCGQPLMSLALIQHLFLAMILVTYKAIQELDLQYMILALIIILHFSMDT